MPYKDRKDLYAAQKRHRVRVRKQLQEYMLDKECIDCGEMDSVVLEFDHKDPNRKEKEVSRMLSGHYAWKTVLKEIEKCDVRCANCHRRKHHKERNAPVA